MQPASPSSLPEPPETPGPKASVLVAFPYWTPEVEARAIAAGDRVRWLIDSGAFTAWKAGKPIALDDYCRFLERIAVKPWRYFTLDVIGDPEASLRNYDTMLCRGFKPIPVFTRGEDPSVLEDYYKTSDVVGIGGLVGTQDNRGYVNGIMRRVGKRRVHWLGFAKIDYIKAYRPYMCDANTWESGGRYARVRLYLGSGRCVDITKKTFMQLPKQEILDRVRLFGFDPMRLRLEEAWRGGRSDARRLAATGSLAFTMEMEQAIGTKMFHAVATPEAVSFFIESFDHLMKIRPNARR